ncbi:hypothetical protein PHLCEN_2v856 [Hermanssonia centrifuga]|uniref:Uncharacterized protein n=1 Tax=Hermanssonia centrifuga TaxID=98765 RepID=A0A2R6S4R9_9APHY|nr:hypothetical protein PHLCEN_2v856 [Hermanssonia centrifuga]
MLHKNAFKITTIRNAFISSGIRPNADGSELQCDINVFSAEDFAPSISTSAQLHLPESFLHDLGNNLDDSEIVQDEPEYMFTSSENGEDDESSASDLEDSTVAVPTFQAQVVDDHADRSDLDDVDEDFHPSETSVCSNDEYGREIQQQDENDGYQADQDEDESKDEQEVLPQTPRNALLLSSQFSTSVHTRSQAQTVAAQDPATALADCTSSHPLIAHYNDSDSSNDSLPSNSDDSAEYYKAKALRWKARCKSARRERCAATTHAILAGRTIHDLQRKLNHKNRKDHDRNVTIGGHIITTQEGRAEALKQRKVREEKAAKAEQLKNKQEDEKYEQRRRRETEGKEGMIFTGALSGLKRPVLLDLAWSLGLEEKGTQEELIIQIRAHVESTPTLKNDSRYAAVFASRSSRKRPAQDKNQDGGAAAGLALHTSSTCNE